VAMQHPPSADRKPEGSTEAKKGKGGGGPEAPGSIDNV